MPSQFAGWVLVDDVHHSGHPVRVRVSGQSIRNGSSKTKYDTVLSLSGTNTISPVGSASIVIIQHAAFAVNVEGSFKLAPDQQGDVNFGTGLKRHVDLDRP